MQVPKENYFSERRKEKGGSSGPGTRRFFTDARSESGSGVARDCWRPEEERGESAVNRPGGRDRNRTGEATLRAF